jgi:hypothetical protein
MMAPVAWRRQLGQHGNLAVAIIPVEIGMERDLIALVVAKQVHFTQPRDLEVPNFAVQRLDDAEQLARQPVYYPIMGLEPDHVALAYAHAKARNVLRERRPVPCGSILQPAYDRMTFPSRKCRLA